MASDSLWDRGGMPSTISTLYRASARVRHPAGDRMDAAVQLLEDVASA